MAGWLSVEDAEAQIEAASEKYVEAETDGDYILQDRFDWQNNDFAGNETWVYGNDMTELHSSSAYNSNGDYIGEVYTTGSAVAGLVATDFEAGVVNAIMNGEIYQYGGPVPGAGQGYPDTAGTTGYADSLVLAEASKITGVKWF